MKELNLKDIWHGISEKEELIINTKQLMEDFKYKMKHREGIVKRRDQREIIAALLGIIGFIYTYYAYPNTLSRLGSVLGMLSLIYVVYKLRNNRKNKLVPDLTLSMRDQLSYQRQFMMKQHKLLDTVAYWMSMPILAANALLIWGISNAEDTQFVWEQVSYKWEAKLIMTMVLGIFFGYIAWMNKKAARINWEPLILQINTLIRNMEEGKKA